MNEVTGTITSIATIGEIFQKSPTINRLILKQVGQSAWEITKCDGELPNNLREVAERSAGKFAYERNIKRGFEALSGYDINSDEQIKVVYRHSIHSIHSMNSITLFEVTTDEFFRLRDDLKIWAKSSNKNPGDGIQGASNPMLTTNMGSPIEIRYFVDDSFFVMFPEWEICVK